MLSPLLVAGFVHRISSVSLGYWLVWCGSFALSIVLLVLLRAQWVQSRPLQKCAVLSLLAHLMLACVAMMIRVVAGEGGGVATGPPIRVRIVEDSVSDSLTVNLPAAKEQEFEPPKLLESPPANESEQVAETKPESAAADEAPPLVDITPAESNEDVAQFQAPSTEELVADTRQTSEVESESASNPVPTEPIASDVPDESAPVDTTERTNESQEAASPAAAPAADAYSLRNAPGKIGLIQMQGGNEQTEAAVAAALAWLARAQSPDGRWDANRFGAGQEQTVLGHNRGGAGRSADTGISALALLAFLGAGHTHEHGDYQDTVRRGLEFLIRSQASDGSVFGDATLYAQMYCHSMATFALAEGQAMTGDRRLEPAVAKAVGYGLRAQHLATGGWRYRPGDTGDTSQLGWQMMALASAQRAGIDVPSHTWTRVGRFLRSVRRGNYQGLASYRPDGPPTTSMTAEALYCQLLLEEMAGERVAEPAAAEATGHLLASLPDGKRINLYYWYYATLALHHRQQASDQAAAAWLSWNDALTSALLGSQLSEGPDAGSWNTNTVWGGYGGRVYTTAMAAMCLEVYYRYAPAPSPGRWTATPPGFVPSSR